MGVLSNLTGAIFGDGGAKDAKKASRQAAAAEASRQQAISAGTTNVRNAFAKTYTPDFYEQFRRSIQNYYLPQIETQHQDASKNLLYALTRQGLGDSSVRGDQYGKLDARNTQARQDVVRRGESMVDQRKNEVARALESSVMQINASENPAAAAQMGAQNASLATYSPDYQPLGQVFVDLTNALAQQSILVDRGENRYQTPSWMSWATSSGRQRT